MEFSALKRICDNRRYYPHFKYKLSICDSICSRSFRTLEIQKKISVLEWVIIVQELMSISEQKTSYTDRYIRYYGSGKHTLTSAVKLLPQAPELPKQILIKRLTLRFLLSIGAKDVIQDLIQADKCL